MTTRAAPADSTDSADSAVVAGRGALFIGFAKGWFMLAGFVQQVFLTRIIGLADYGAFSVVNNFISIINNTVVQATIQSISKFTSEDDRRADAVKRAGLQIQLYVGLALAALLFLVAPLVAGFVKAPHYTPYFRIAAVIPLLYAVYAVFVGSANGLRRFRAQAGFDVTFSTAKTFLLLGCAALWQVSGAFAGFAAAAVVIVLVAARVMGLPTAGTDAFSKKTLGRYMFAVVTYNILLNLALLYDQPLLHHFAGRVDPATAGEVAARYQALRTLALLPYQALLVITFVIFPLVSRSTFVEDREATRAYVTQTLRYALILSVGMGLCLGARPAALLAIIYKPEYGVGAPALPILVAAQCCLAMLAVSCAILNAAGRTRASQVLVAITVAVGVVAAALLVPAAAPGQGTLVAAATATALGMATGFVGSVLYMRQRLGGHPPLRTIARVAAAIVAAVLVGRFLPGQGKVLGLVATVLVGVVYFAVLIATGEFGPADRAKFGRILRRR